MFVRRTLEENLEGGVKGESRLKKRFGSKGSYEDHIKYGKGEKVSGVFLWRVDC